MKRSDPTGTYRIRRKSASRINLRLRNAERRVKALFRGITVNTEYNVQDTEQLAANVEYIVNDELLESQSRKPFRWYHDKDIEEVYRKGTVTEVNHFNQLIAGAIIAGAFRGKIAPQPVEPMQILFSDNYREALTKQYNSSFTNIKSMSQKTAGQVMGVINRGMESKLGRAEIARQISERFDASRADAKRITDTETTKAYVDAKIEATKVSATQTGLRAGVIHISALLSTTRKPHAARHGLAYTVEQQTAWLNEGANRINCKCDVESALIDSQGNLVDPDRQQSIEAEGKEFYQ